MSKELVPLDEAAVMSERSPSTLRRWIRDGKLTRHEGPPRAEGGSAQVLIERDELMAHLAVSGQQPKESTPVQEEEQVSIEPPATGVHAGVHQAELKILRLEGELQAERLRGQLQALQMERDALKEELLRERQRATLETNELRDERDGWRDRHDAVRAELDARRASGWSWFPRLLSTA